MAKVGIFVGTVYGNAQLVAEKAEAILTAQGHQVSLFEEPEWQDWLDFQQQVVLVVTSTTGQGEIPDNLRPIYQSIRDKLGVQSELRYGVIALGDSSYENFCGAGHQFEALLQEQAATQVGTLLEIDASLEAEPENAAVGWVEAWGSQLLS